jgi:hypothetical protein
MTKTDKTYTCTKCGAKGLDWHTVNIALGHYIGTHHLEVKWCGPIVEEKKVNGEKR